MPQDCTLLVWNHLSLAHTLFPSLTRLLSSSLSLVHTHTPTRYPVAAQKNTHAHTGTSAHTCKHSGLVNLLLSRRPPSAPPAPDVSLLFVSFDNLFSSSLHLRGARCASVSNCRLIWSGYASKWVTWHLLDGLRGESLCDGSVCGFFYAAFYFQVECTAHIYKCWIQINTYPSLNCYLCRFSFLKILLFLIVSLLSNTTQDKSWIGSFQISVLCRYFKNCSGI